MRENVVDWYNGLTDKEKITLLETITGKGLVFLDDVLTPIYCKLNNIELE
jgi:hypothetical protein